jgi:RND family efflux transporter MFP subunit
MLSFNLNFNKLILLFLISLLFSSCLKDESSENTEEESIPVEIILIEPEEISFPIHSAGMVSMKETVNLSFKVGGIIDDIFVDEGQTVEIGQILARLNLLEINAQVSKAQSAFEKSTRDLERVKSLFENNVATLEQLQDVETAYNIALSDLTVTQFNLKHSSIVAPDNGKILKRFFEESELISPGSPVFIFASTEKNLILRFSVIDEDVVRLTLLDPADLFFDVFPDTIFTAYVSEIAEAADLLTGTFEVELTIEDKENDIEEKLVSGFIAKLDLYPSKTDVQTLVPISSIVEGDKNTGFVYTVNSDFKAVKVPVVISKLIDRSAVVSGGLENINFIVTSGVSYLTDGALVKILNPDILQNTASNNNMLINPQSSY